MWRQACVLAVVLVAVAGRFVPVRESLPAGMEASELIDASEVDVVDSGLRELPGAQGTDKSDDGDADELGNLEADDTPQSNHPFPSLAHTHLHVGEGDSDGANKPGRVAWSEGGRDEMAPRDGDMPDDDCDSPQLGEEEEMPQSQVDIDMNGHLNTTQMPEQDVEEREALADSEDFVASPDDAPVARARFENSSHPSFHKQPVDERFSVATLPPPSPDVQRSLKCSRSTNGNDVPPALDDLGEDCGQAEPEIPCETPGNSTLCAPHLVLTPPPAPAAELMPPKPPPHVDPPRREREVSVEFVDFGVPQVTYATNDTRVGAIIRDAGKRFGVEVSDVLTIHNAGAAVLAWRLVSQLEDPTTLVVYLKCANADHADDLLVQLPDCATMHIQELEVRVEVPETNDVFTVDALNTESVEDVLFRTPVRPVSIDKVTYNGKRLINSTTLDQLGFVNGSAFVVYLVPMPVLTSPLSILPPPSSSSSSPSSSSGLDQDNAATAGTTTGEADVSQLGRPLPVPIPVPEIDHDPWPRPEMTEPAVVTVRIEGSTSLDFPILLQPDDKGLVVVEAVHERVGSSFTKINVVFHGLYIRQETELAPFGFREGDVIVATVL